ncbi:L-2-amino-thiazoline-4-carboxylic acid hydrolase [Pseudaminobacter sp. 19-2017]|uniref:L-2-amino-thiazoline-4-carboxylic acid hydrolase n=1 Tax=Pseudaminobacter soli (ex Zhang et al. 2022) TaxID=2831468 RepID=A0A942DYH6_9HYPH|nr:L-2-amino-thiazoline-4-carboxylic acid hydrolase [Pseudaminobacter soli]MBS3650294.1 L-2-amino-thiazoline-4-carboxylic acid hydrolase [Pseudaminobacter soli]
MNQQEELPTLVKRRIQAQVIGPIYQELVAAIGKDQADTIIDSAIRKAAVEEGRRFAAKAPGGITSMADFIKLYELWTHDGALEIEVQQASDTVFDFDVTRCRYAEMYRDMGLGHIGHLLSCNRDGTFCQGYDPNIKLDREHTIMAGAPRCTFRYRYERQEQPRETSGQSSEEPSART